MKIAILGGTGPEGAGLALRWALAGHEVTTGPRQAEPAKAKAAELSERAKGATIVGMANREAAAAGAVVVLALPAAGLAATLPGVKEAGRGGSGGAPRAPLGPGANVVAPSPHIAANELAPEHSTPRDLLLCGDDAAAKATVAD